MSIATMLICIHATISCQQSHILLKGHSKEEEPIYVFIIANFLRHNKTLINNAFF